MNSRIPFKLTRVILLFGGLALPATFVSCENRAAERPAASASKPQEAAPAPQPLAVEDGPPPAETTTPPVADSSSSSQGAQLFMKACMECHNYAPRDEKAMANFKHKDLINSEATAPNLYGFASREWIAGMLDPKQVAGPHYLGYQESPFASGDMVNFIHSAFKSPDAEELVAVQQLVAALSAEAKLPGQAEIERQEEAKIATGRELLAGRLGCTDCHKFHEHGAIGEAPDLTGYGSREWLKAFIGNPASERFYHESNDRMPAFDGGQDSPLDAESLDIVIDWLRTEAAK